MNKKILIATGIFPPDIGGPATMLKALTDGLISRGFDIEILTYGDKSGNDKNVYRINKHLPFRLSQYKYYFKLGSLCQSVDVIYATDTYSVGFFTYLMKKKFNKKYILRFTGDSAWETARANGWTDDYILDFQDKKYDDKIEKLKTRRNKILLNADKIIVDCKFNKKLAMKILNVGTGRDLSEKIKIIYNSVDFMDLKPNRKRLSEIQKKYKLTPPSPPLKMGGEKQKKILVTACRLTRWKGVDKIIQVVKNMDNVNFIVLGDGPELENLEKMAGDNVHFLGRVKRDEAINYIKAADAFILNSDYEGASHALLEVMQINTPIIATRSGGNPELIEDGKNGLLINYGNSQELTNAIKKVLDNFQIQTVANKFKWQEVVNKTQEVIDGLGK